MFWSRSSDVKAVPWGGEHPTYGLQERRGKGVDEKNVGVLPKERAGESGGEKEIAKRGCNDETGSGEVRAAPGGEWRSNEAGGDGTPKSVKQR